jgi:tricorn protease
MWLGDSIFYLSDPDGHVGLYRFDVKTGRQTVEVRGGQGQLDIRSASAGFGAVVFERLGSLWLYDAATREAKQVPVTLDGDFPEVRVQFKDLARNLSGLSLSPSANRVVGSARGYIFTAPASKGDSRILTPGEPGIWRRDPIWSPDGKTIAYITHEGPQQQLALLDLATNQTKTLRLGAGDHNFSTQSWSPDSKKILYSDNTLALWVMDVASGQSTKIDTAVRRGRIQIEGTWSPDSRWVAYQRDLRNYMGAIFLYSLETGTATQVTDGLADASNPVFDRDGRHLFFMASTDVGLGGDIQDIASFASANITHSIYGIVLKKGGVNPLAPESDEEPGGLPAVTPPAAPGAPRPPVKTEIDLDGLELRTFTVPLPRQRYAGIGVGTAGNLLALSLPNRASGIDFAPGGGTLARYSFGERRATPLGTGVVGFQTTPDGTKMLVSGMGGSQIVPTMAPFAPGQGSLNVTGLSLRIDPRVEWRNMFKEAIHAQKINFYDPGLHRVDLDSLAKRYEGFLPHLRTRSQLNEVFTDLFGELSVGHMFIGGGDIPGRASLPGGLLGADYTFENGRYRLARVYTGERWNPGLFGPLAQPGIEAKAGEYLLAIDGRELTSEMDVYLALEGKAGRQVRVKIGPTPDGAGAREGVVVPVASETQLRFRAWTEDNRRRVLEATNGRVAYVHVPDTSVGGWREFMRYYYSQSGMDAVIIDERFNGGGSIADFLVREMTKDIVAFSRTRHGEGYTIPPMGIYGPKVMLINELAGSGGDILPWLFRFHKVGPIIGKRTWGAMISNFGFGLADGGFISSPDDAMYDTNGKWIIENVGTPPDIEVELDPSLWRQGRDAQLERAIVEILNLLAKNPLRRPMRPDYPSIPPFRPSGIR